MFHVKHYEINHKTYMIVSRETTAKISIIIHDDHICAILMQIIHERGSCGLV